MLESRLKCEVIGTKKDAQPSPSATACKAEVQSNIPVWTKPSTAQKRVNIRKRWWMHKSIDRLMLLVRLSRFVFLAWCLFHYSWCWWRRKNFLIKIDFLHFVMVRALSFFFCLMAQATRKQPTRRQEVFELSMWNPMHNLFSCRPSSTWFALSIFIWK